MKLQEEFKDSGFTIIATHVQNATKDQVLGFLRSNKVNYTVTSFGEVPGEKVSGIPAAFLFDSKGDLVESGHPTGMKAKIQELVSSSPHWLAAGTEYSRLKPIAESLKQAKVYGPILKKLESEKKAGGAAAEEAEYLSGRILEQGKKRLAEAKALETEDALGANQAYADVANRWKGSEPGTAATSRMKELKGDKEFQTELKASTMARQILAECEKLVPVQGKINLEYASNKKIAAQVRAAVPALKKKYPDTKAAAKISSQLESYGFKGL